MKNYVYESVNEFYAQYSGEWNPSEGKWLGLDFSYLGIEYRLHTGNMYEKKNTILPDGRTALFGLYKKKGHPDEYDGREYELLAEYAALDELLDSYIINGQQFKDIIISDGIKLLGQD